MSGRRLDCSPEEYHKLPGFSASVARELHRRNSPLHAKVYRETSDIADMSEEMVRGSVIHHLLLGKGAKYQVCPFDSFRSDAAKKTKRDYHAAGIIPVLTLKLEQYEAAANALRKNLSDVGVVFDGESEVALVWDESGLPCRCMFDHMRVDDDVHEIIEIKVQENVEPSRVERHVEDMAYRIPAAAYIRAAVAWRPELSGRLRYRFAFCEPVEPYAVYCPEPDALFIETGERDWLAACRMWAKCEREQRWPAYQEYASISRPQWKLRQEGFGRDEW